MVWRADAPQGAEAEKVRFEVVDLFHGTALDLGCGPSKIFPSKNVIGIDSDKDVQLFGIRSNPDIYGDATDLRLFGDASVEVVFSSHMIEHVEDYVGALREWWRVLKVGGRLILYVPHADHYPNIGMPGSNPDHKHDFRNEDISKAMEQVARQDGNGWILERDEVRTEGLEYSFLQVYRKREEPYFTHEIRLLQKKSLGIVRLGAYGDALWISAVLPRLKAEGWHITVYTQPQGEASLRGNPYIDRLSVQAEGIFGREPFVSGAVTAELQTRYWLDCEKRHAKFINLVGSVERSLLPFASDPNFYLPDEQRRRLFGRNYVEAVHEWAGVAFDRSKVRVRFYPTPEERAWAEAERAKYPGPMVIIQPGGSSLPKWWPHAQKAMELFSAAGIGGILLGETRLTKFVAPPLWTVAGKQWDIRKCYALAALADVVIGTESAIVNSVAHEPPLKIVLLSHSSAENLTRDWHRTIALVPEGLPCYPCHRIHSDWRFCTPNPATGSSACQSAFTAETVVETAMQILRQSKGKH